MLAEYFDVPVSDLIPDKTNAETIVSKNKTIDQQKKAIIGLLIGHLREFCVSVFRQNQEYHVINVHDGAYSPWLQLSRKVGAVCAPCTA